MSEKDYGLTEEESEVMDNLVKAWNAFVDLPEQHPDDIPEFRHGLHRLQHLVMVRQVRRSDDEYTNMERDERPDSYESLSDLMQAVKGHACKSREMLASDDHHHHMIGYVCLGCSESFQVLLSQLRKELPTASKVLIKSLKTACGRRELAESINKRWREK